MEMCARPGAVTDDDLVAYAYDEAPPEVVQHVRACPACARTADGHRRFQARIGALLNRIDCPSPHTLGEHHLRLLTPEEGRQIAAHVAECPACADEARMLSRFLVSEPPAEPAGVIEQVKRLVATLMTPAPEAAYAGLRGASDAITRTYQAADLTITVRLGAGARRGYRRLSGVIWREGVDSEALAGHVLRLVDRDGAERTTEIGDLGDFAFDTVEPGSYRLEVELHDSVVVVEELLLED